VPAIVVHAIVNFLCVVMGVIWAGRYFEFAFGTSASSGGIVALLVPLVDAEDCKAHTKLPFAVLHVDLPVLVYRFSDRAVGVVYAAI